MINGAENDTPTGAGTVDDGDLSKRQKKKQTEQRSRQKAKRLKLYGAIEWGDYNPDFPTLGREGPSELQSFLKRLERVSTFPNTRKDTTARLLARLNQYSKLDILIQLESELRNLPEDDLVLLTDTESLKTVLKQSFQVPLVHRASIDHPSLGPSERFGIQDFLQHLAEDDEASISVYDYSISDPCQRTRKTSVRELLTRFQSGNSCGTALNFLDIENRTNIQFCPSPILLQDITTKLEARKHKDKGKTRSDFKAEPRNEFFLASLKNAISTIHVDTGGALTWILILTGRKIWYFPRKVTAEKVRLLALVGSQHPEDYEDGWVKVELRAGDLL